MQELDNSAQKLRTIFMKSSSHMPIADEAAANKVLEGYKSLQHASDRLFDLLIVVENTGQTVSTLYSLTDHFFLANVLDGGSEPIADTLNNVAACLPRIVKSNGKKIPSDFVQPGVPATEVTAFVRAFDNEFEWLEAMLIGRAFSILKRFSISNARTKAVAEAATRIKRRGYSFSIHSGKYKLKAESVEYIVGEIWKCLHRVGCLNALGNIMQIAIETQGYAYEQILFGRKYAEGMGDRSPGLPIGLLYNIAIKLPARGSNERNAKSFWEKAVRLACDFIAMLDIEPYSQFGYLGLDVQSLEDGLREVAHYDHCFTLRQWHLSFTHQFLASFFGDSFDKDMKQQLGWSIADAVRLAQVLRVHAKPGTQVVPAQLLEDSFGQGVFKSMLPFFAHSEGEVNKKYRSPFGAEGPDAIFKPLIQLKGNSIVLPAASVLGPALFEATFAAWRVNKAQNEIDDLRGKGTERLTKNLFVKHGFQPRFEGAKYDMGEIGAGECDFVFEDEKNIILVECKAKALTRGAMTGTQGDALLDFAGGLFASQVQALRHERILRSSGVINFCDGAMLKFGGRRITRLTVTLLDHGALQDRSMLMNVYNALLSSQVTCDSDYTKKKQIDDLNKNLFLFQEETRLLETIEKNIFAHSLNAASVSMAQLDILLESAHSLCDLRARLTPHVTYSSLNMLKEYFLYQNLRRS